MVDVDGKLIVKYTTDGSQLTCLADNGYITADKQSSAPFYQCYDGIPIIEEPDLDWTVIKGYSFDALAQVSAFIQVINTNGMVDFKTITYTGVNY